MVKKQKKLDKKRRRERKTNYKKRLILLKGNCARFVVRKTNRYIIMQITESKHAQDKVLCSVNTKELLKYGWSENKKGSLKSVSAAYLGGLLLGKKVKDIKKVILDSGLIPSTKGSRIYACVKGIADSGIEINYDEKVLPSEERIKQIKDLDFDKIKEAINKK